MILCAGLGTRLRPITDVWPKPAVPLLGQPLIRYALSTLVQAGITDVGINTHHLPEVMEKTARAECERLGCSLTVAHEAGEIQGTGGGIRGLRAFLRDGPFVVMNGDVLFAVQLAEVIAAHLQSEAAATMVLLPMPEGEKYNPVEVDAQMHVRRIAGQGPGGSRLTGWHFTGVHVINPEVFDFMKASGPEDINRDTYLAMVAAGRTVRGHVLRDRDAYWSDLGTPERYMATHRDLLFGQVKTERFGAADPLGAKTGNGWTVPAAADLKFAGPAWFSPSSSVGAGCRLGTAVSVGRAAVLRDGVSLNRVAVLDGAEVPAGQHHEDAIIAPNAVVPAVVSYRRCG